MAKALEIYHIPCWSDCREHHDGFPCSMLNQFNKSVSHTIFSSLVPMHAASILGRITLFWAYDVSHPGLCSTHQQKEAKLSELYAQHVPLSIIICWLNSSKGMPWGWRGTCGIMMVSTKGRGCNQEFANEQEKCDNECARKNYSSYFNNYYVPYLYSQKWYMSYIRVMLIGAILNNSWSHICITLVLTKKHIFYSIRIPFKKLAFSRELLQASTRYLLDNCLGLCREGGRHWTSTENH